ncbi:MAG TPA: DUF72 domain-containing protein [Candidatus Thermoplasmatota archaeon]
MPPRPRPFRIGCSGWSYDDWKGVFYPQNVRSMLRDYSAVFDTAEVNASFYALPDEGVVRGWARYTPPGFSIAAKVPQTVTHEKRLRGAGDDLAAFCRRMEPVREAGKLGPLLLQLPPRLGFDPERASDFFAELPKGFRFALEPREPSWLEPPAVAALREAAVCLVAVDEPLLPPALHVTADFLYVRWHGHGKRPWYNYEYTKGQLAPWVPRIKEALEGTDRGWGFFNNHYHGYGPKNALQTLAEFGPLTGAQRDRLAALESGSLAPAGGGASLDAFAKAAAPDPQVARILKRLTDAGRYERAHEIDSKDMALSRVEPHFVRADVRGTRIQMDLVRQEMRHSCQDFERGLAQRRVCKHIVRLLIELPPEIAREFADDLDRSRADWTFERYWGGGGGAAD